MILYSLCVNPLLTTLHGALPGVQIDHRNEHTTITAYADDVSIFITSPGDIPTVGDVLRTFEKASGAKISTTKSKILALSNWNTQLDILGVPYTDTLPILGMTLSTSIALSSKASWAKTITKIKAKAQADYSRILMFDSRVRFVHEQLYVHAWFLA
jgi:hypothetical protein